jgi:hypothetical protein
MNLEFIRVVEDGISHSLKRMINIGIPYTVGNFEYRTGHNFFKSQASSWCQEIECKELFATDCSYGKIMTYTEP